MPICVNILLLRVDWLMRDRCHIIGIIFAPQCVAERGCNYVEGAALGRNAETTKYIGM